MSHSVKKRKARCEAPTPVGRVLALSAALSGSQRSLNLNNATLLLDCLLGCDEAETTAAALQLQHFFSHQLREESFLTACAPVSGEKTAETQLHAWLQKTYAVFMDRLVALLCRADVAVSTQYTALETLMECMRTEHAGAFNNLLYERVLTDMLRSPAFNAELMGALVSRYLQHTDVNFYTYTALRKLFDAHGSAGAESLGDDAVRNAFDVLCNTPVRFGADPSGGGKGEEEEAGPWCDWKPQEGAAVGGKRRRGAASSGTARWADPIRRRRAFSEAWLAFLRLQLPLDLYKKVLARLHVMVMPHLVNPLLLSDFLTRAIDLGSLLGMLALNGLFILMTQQGLEYPEFYTRLYALLEPGVFQSRHRRQFFELLDVFLRSTHLPAFLAAAFAKRLARLTLSAPPHGAMLSIAFVHNLLRRHPGVCVLLHRERVAGAAGSAQDPFLPAHQDPARCRALESSLWELEQLRTHFSPAVSRFVAVLERELGNRRKTQELELGALAGASYASLFAEETERRLKAVPLAFYPPGSEPLRLWDLGEAPEFAGLCS